MSLKNKLNRLKKHVVRDETEQKSENFQQQSYDPEQLLWDEHNTQIIHYDGQTCFIREVVYPLDYQHGKYQLKEFQHVVSMWNQSDLKHPLSSKDHQASDLFFFDTETTGLGGGAGNTIFLLGQAQVLEDRVVVKQYLLPKPGNEVALYQSFLEGINSKTLVTYNGKAFDWPQVKTRHTLIRELVPKLPAFGHFDLFHAARRLWKKELESVRLAKVENDILGIYRENDIPGFLAPMIYFEFVKQQKPEIIMGVLKHNEIDVLSLITLYIHLSYKLLSTNDKATDSEHYEVARWLDYVGDQSSALDAYKSLMEKSTKQDVEAKYALALLYKKQKEWKQAINLWNEIVEGSKGKVAIRALEELAKYYEHKEKDLQRATKHTEEMYILFKECKETLSFIDENDILNRLNRLKRKFSKNIPRASAETE